MSEARGTNLLAAAGKVWSDCKSDLQARERPSNGEDDELVDGPLLPAAELKKVTKWLQQTLTKFGATAAVAEGEDRDRALRPMADEVLDRAKQFERISTHNRASLRRRLLRSLAQLRDAERELVEALATEGKGEDEDEDDLGGFDDALEPDERRLVEAVAAAASALEDILKQVSHACMPGSATPDAEGERPAMRGALLDVPDLEVAVVHAASAVNAVDGLAASTIGGIDRPALVSAMADFRSAAAGLRVVAEESMALALEAALDGAQAAMEAAKEDVSP